MQQNVQDSSLSTLEGPLRPRPAPQPGSGDGFVLLAMALVTAAVTVGLHLQLGFPLAAAVLMGLALFVGLSGFQAFWRSSAQQHALAAEITRLEAELGRRRHETPPMVPGAPRQAMMGLRDGQRGPTRAAPAPSASAPPFPSQPPALAPSLPDPAPAALSSSAPDPEAAVGSSTERPSPPAPSAVREDDVEMLQRRIKAMLLEVTAAENARDAEASDAPPLAAAGVETSLSALRAAAASMRTATSPERKRETAPPLDPVVEPAVQKAREREAAIRAAVGAGRVDVFLEPIMGLHDQSARHYEVSVRLRGAAGEDLGTGEGDIELDGRGLLPLFDRVRLEHTANIAGRLTDRGKDGSVFSRTSGEALNDADFRSAATGRVPSREGIAEKLVLTFSQSDVRAFRAAEQRAVAALAALGFRFAVADLTDLDMNFEAMAKAGFAFAKLDASVFLEGLPYPGGTIPASDVCRHLAGLGYAVVVDKIADEATLARIFGFGVVLGQGTLFGGRRPVKSGTPTRSGQVAA